MEEDGFGERDADCVFIQLLPNLLVLSLTAEMLPRVWCSLTCRELCQADAPCSRFIRLRAGLSVERADNLLPALPQAMGMEHIQIKSYTCFRRHLNLGVTRLYKF